MKTYKYIIDGRVQGVWYRKTAKEYADKHSIPGYAKNLPDGRVEVVATLITQEDAEKFANHLRKGSMLSSVDSIFFEKIAYIDFNGFSIK